MINGISSSMAIGDPIWPTLVKPIGPRATPADPPTPSNAAAEALPPVHLKFSGEIIQESQQLHDGLQILWALA